MTNMSTCDFILGFVAGFWAVILVRTIRAKIKRDKQHAADLLEKK